MEKQRFIFDLDGTLLEANFSYERAYFKSVLSNDEFDYFMPMIGTLLNEYERTHIKYDVSLLSGFLTRKTDIKFTDRIIGEWIDFSLAFSDKVVDGVVESLEYLKDKGKSLAVLTNWFYAVQVERLKRTSLYPYFDAVYSGSSLLKPNLLSYKTACGPFSIDEAVIVGDSLDFDVLVPLEIGMEAVYYNPKNRDDFDKRLVKSINNMIEIKEMY